MEIPSVNSLTFCWCSKKEIFTGGGGRPTAAPFEAPSVALRLLLYRAARLNATAELKEKPSCHGQGCRGRPLRRRTAAPAPAFQAVRAIPARGWHFRQCPRRRP